MWKLFLEVGYKFLELFRDISVRVFCNVIIIGYLIDFFKAEVNKKLMVI